MHLPMRGIHIFEKPYYREIRPMRGRHMRGPPVVLWQGRVLIEIGIFSYVPNYKL